MMYQSKFGSNQPSMSAKPRRVRGGVRLEARELPLSVGWVGAAWIEASSVRTTPERIAEGFVYARGGQTRSVEVGAGKIVGLVQGRAIKAYRVTIEAPRFSEEEWERVIGAMSDQAIFGAKMLAGEMPAAMVGLFASLGLRLIPGAEELTTGCSACGRREGSGGGVVGVEVGGWCKHACCLGLLVAEMFDRRPFEVFTLRGMAPGELMERLREKRSGSAGLGSGAMGGGGFGGIEAIVPAGREQGADLGNGGGRDSEALPGNGGGGISETSKPLEACIEEFWEIQGGDAALEAIETPLRKPEVHHALLRRLGPSPFAEGRFPLVGLLATCYDTISRSALENPEEAPEIRPPAPVPPEAKPILPSEGGAAGPKEAGGAWPLGTAKRKTR